MRVVLDTNILVSALGWKDGNQFAIIRKCFTKELTLIYSSNILEEFEKVVQRPHFEFFSEEIDEFISKILEIGEMVQPEEKHTVITKDPTDNIVIDAAVAGKADYIVSGDKHLLDLKKFKGIKILRATEFLKLL